MRLESGAVEIPVVDEGSRVEEFSQWRRANRRQHAHLSLEERAQIILLFHQANHRLVVIALTEDLALGIHQIRNQSAAYPSQVTVHPVNLGFHSNRHRPFDKLHRKAKGDLFEASKATGWMQQQRCLSEHLKRHDAGVIGNTFDGMVVKEGVVGRGERALRCQPLTFLKRHDFVNKREASGVRHGGSHRTREFEGCLTEGRKPVHQTEGPATQDPPLTTPQGFIHKDGDAVFNREGFDASSSEHGFNGTARCHTDIAPAGPTDGNSAARMGGCETSHFCIEHRIRCSVVGLSTVAKSPCDAGETARKGRRIRARCLHR